jgi:hypothetical protein
MCILQFHTNQGFRIKNILQPKLMRVKSMFYNSFQILFVEHFHHSKVNIIRM